MKEQQKAIARAVRLLQDAWAAGYRQGLDRRAGDYSLPDEVRQFAIAIKNQEHFKAANGLPDVVFEIGPFAITRRMKLSAGPSGKPPTR